MGVPDSRVERPDVLLVVMDCLRTDVFDSVVADGRTTPFLTSLRPEVEEFGGAVSPASWTIPGHASLFTGLYPWDHGAHYRSGTSLPPEPETLAERLGREGYARALFSANAYIQPASGLTRGFEESSWGGAGEFFLRFLARDRASCPTLLGAPAGALARTPLGTSAEGRWNAFISLLSGAPPVWDGLNRVGAKVRGTYATGLPTVAPWIESSVDRWLDRQAPNRPVFAFVNLLEAHEPYLAGGGHPVGLRDWLGYARAAQHPVLWVKGEWEPRPRDLATARAAYAASLRTIDRRMRSLVDIFRQHGRWENTLLILTSDHGQAFLENDSLFHRFRVDEPISRIPLWIRTPGAGSPGRRTEDWVSLIDLPRTIVEFLGQDSFGDPSSRPLVRPRPEAERAVYAMTDGLAPSEGPGLPPHRREFLDRLEIAAYVGSMKSVLSERGSPRVYRVSRTDARPVPPAVDGGPGSDVAASAARGAFDLAVARIASRPQHGSVEQRIAGWGY